jgi:hypothetical protein
VLDKSLRKVPFSKSRELFVPQQKRFVRLEQVQLHKK